MCLLLDQRRTCVSKAPRRMQNSSTKAKMSGRQPPIESGARQARGRLRPGLERYRVSTSRRCFDCLIMITLPTEGTFISLQGPRTPRAMTWCNHVCDIFCWAICLALTSKEERQQRYSLVVVENLHRHHGQAFPRPYGPVRHLGRCLRPQAGQPGLPVRR